MQSFRRQEHALIYTIPALALTFVFFVVPLGYLIVVSLFKWNGLGPMEFTGLGNYEYIFRNANFHKAFRVTLLWLASALIVHIPFGLLLSLMLNRRPHGWKFLRVMYFIPNVISTTAVAFMWYFTAAWPNIWSPCGAIILNCFTGMAAERGIHWIMDAGAGATLSGNCPAMSM